MSQTFFTADTHFSHAAAIDMCNRPFKSADQMNSALVAAWNQTVGPRDIVWHLGDFSFGPVEDGEKIFRKLNGQKHLIRGNHDKRTVDDWAWASVSDQKMIKVGDQKVFLCHYPMLEWPGFFRETVHLYGHVHGNRTVPGRACDVGVDVWGYRPVTLDEIMPRLERSERPKPETINERLGGHARQMLDIADNSFEAWERSYLAEALAQTAVQVGNEIIAQKTDQLGYTDLDDDAAVMSGPRF